MAWIHPDFTNQERHDELADRLGRAERSGDVGLAARIRQAVADLFAAEWGAFGPREPRRGIRILDEYVSAALTASATKKEWIIDTPCELLGIRIDSGGAGSGAGSSTIDVNKNGTTIFTTQGNRPTIATASTGDWTTGFPDGSRSYVAGDIIAYDVDAIPATTGHTRTKGAIALRFN